MSVLNGAGLEGKAGRVVKRGGKTNEIKGWSHQGHLGNSQARLQAAKDSETIGGCF